MMETIDTFFQRAAVSPLTGEKSSILVQTFWIVVFAAVTALGAQVEIPHQPVPYTLQTFLFCWEAHSWEAATDR